MTGASGLVGRALCEALVREGALIRVLSRDPHRARQQADAGREVVLRRYDWGRLAEQMERLWLSCAPTHNDDAEV